ncbi:hypothetical protein [Paenalcaligenes suwonensis]|uniref:hypothetical protein n=1 Tax=Paenalcaligenes suwonensis TaxID=1202713 RepID=UPI001407E9AA|nr:hypothetical protein [Paenalcaligenes suwonensis]NHC63087.1 hypothetical protein [Paenalcaligenes suwonensis]
MNGVYTWSADNRCSIGYRNQWDASVPSVGFVFLRAPLDIDRVSVQDCEIKAKAMGGGGVDLLFLDPYSFRDDYWPEVSAWALEQLEQCQPVIACWWGKQGRAETVDKYLDLVCESGYRTTLQHFGVKRGVPQFFNAFRSAKPSQWRL